jgi:uncharacterized membrane protein
MRVSIPYRDVVLAPAIWLTLVGLYVWQPVAGLMALSALSGFVAAQHWPRPRLHR